MKNNKGFTLVELLAVIVILAVILVIAIPNVIKIIDKARLDSYKRTEDMLVSAAQKYMAQQGITLNTVGDTTTVSYNTDLKSNNLIDTINDQKSKTECINSKVIVTKATNGYTYKPGLVCDNYISLSSFNLVDNGNFETTSGWGSGGWTIAVNNNKLIVTGNGSTRYIQPNYQSRLKANNGDIIYFRFYQKGPLISGITIYSIAMINAGITQYIKTITTTGSEQLVNNTITLAGQTNGNNVIVYLATTYPANADSLNQVSENRDVVLLNLTDMGLTGLNNNLTALEQLINKSR
jgi:type IV pilus assembly protein PilA